MARRRALPGWEVHPSSLMNHSTRREVRLALPVKRVGPEVYRCIGEDILGVGTVDENGLFRK